MIRLDNVRYQIDVAIYVNKVDLLARVCTLIWVVGDPPQITFGQVEDNLLEGDATLSLQQFVFLRTPFKAHDSMYIECVYRVKGVFRRLFG